MTDKNPNEHDDPTAPTNAPTVTPDDAAPLRKPTREEMRDMSDEEIMAAHGMELGPRLPAEFRLMADKSGNPTHFYPLSMLTYPIYPPPIAVGGPPGWSTSHHATLASWRSSR